MVMMTILMCVDCDTDEPVWGLANGTDRCRQCGSRCTYAVWRSEGPRPTTQFFIGGEWSSTCEGILADALEQRQWATGWMALKGLYPLAGRSDQRL